MPLLVVSIAKEEVIDLVVDMLQICRRHSFEGFRQYPGEPWRFCIFQFCNSFAEFVPADGIIKLPQDAALRDFVQEGRIGCAVVIEHLIEVGRGDRHVLLGICGVQAIR